MKWQDQGFVLSAKRHGESSWILSLLTENHGRHVGIVRLSKKDHALLQLGNLVQATWTARLPEHMGTWQLELISSPLARLMTDPLKLTALTSVTHVLNQILAERHTYPILYQSLNDFIQDLLRTSMDPKQQTRWLKSYVLFELLMLDQLGYGLDLTTCAATGQRDHLSFISPKSGRAVSHEAGLPYQDRLFKLPLFLQGDCPETPPLDVKNALQMTGHFLTTYFFEKGLPESRIRLFEAL